MLLKSFMLGGTVPVGSVHALARQDPGCLPKACNLRLTHDDGTRFVRLCHSRKRDSPDPHLRHGEPANQLSFRLPFPCEPSHHRVPPELRLGPALALALAHAPPSLTDFALSDTRGTSGAVFEAPPPSVATLTFKSNYGYKLTRFAAHFVDGSGLVVRVGPSQVVVLCREPSQLEGYRGEGRQSRMGEGRGVENARKVSFDGQWLRPLSGGRVRRVVWLEQEGGCAAVAVRRVYAVALGE